ncbi:MAG: 50S ribosomal protein L29, partial [Acidobacteriia bacterium]|nr:50S ribosomal protein L29 [Terriglobia bacterium]
EAQEQMFRLRLQMKMGQSEGLKKYRVLRKDRARMFTVERERQMASAAGPVTSASGPVTSKGKSQ